MGNSLLLSVCIPTFERADLLRKTLSHLTNLPIFRSSNEWEIVISDNASQDTTESVAKKFANQHPQRIRYFRNNTNVYDDNFRLALSRGQGLYLKLCNDTLLLTDDGISEMLAQIKSNCREKPNLYFRCDSDSQPIETCETFDQFIRSVGYMCTWIAEYGVWRSKFNELADFGRARAKQLIQVDATFRVLSASPRTIVFHHHFFDTLPKPRHGGYAPSLVFGQNYFSLLRPYVNSNQVSQQAFELDKFRMFRYVILPNYLITSPSFQFPRTDYIRNLWPEYKFKGYFYFFLPFAYLAIPIAFIRKVLSRAHNGIIAKHPPPDTPRPLPPDASGVSADQ